MKDRYGMGEGGTNQQSTELTPKLRPTLPHESILNSSVEHSRLLPRTRQPMSSTCAHEMLLSA
jgi:hypothetical protein